MRFALAAVLLASVADARPQPPRAEFDATIVAIGEPAKFHCGILMATQPVLVDVTRVVKGSIQKTRTILEVMTCSGGPLLRVSANDTLEIDPDQLRRGSRIHVDAEPWHDATWFATPDHITVTKR